MAPPTTDERPDRHRFGHLVRKLRTVGSAMVTREEQSGLSVESRVANRKNGRR